MGDLQQHPRHMEAALTDRLGRSPVVVLSGARQTGKTTLVRGFPGSAGRRFETLDSLATLERAKREPEALILGSPPVTVDEIQRAPELLLGIKMDVDRQRRRGRFLLTGSANLLLMKTVSESLAGRASFLVLRPMTEREKHPLGRPPAWDGLVAAKVVEDALETLPRARPIDWREAALAGGMPPAALARDPDDRELWFQGYVDTYVQRDLRDLAHVADVAPFLRLVRLAALRTGGLMNLTDLARDAALPRSTAQRWLGLLQTTFLITLLPAFAESRSKRLIKAPKLFPLDTGLALHLAGIRDRDELERTLLSGVWLESLVLNDLLVWSEGLIRRPSLFHYRSAGGSEIDFVVEHGRRLLPIEIKSAGSPRVDDGKALEAFCEEHGSRAPFGLLIYGGQDALVLSRRVLAVPLGAVL
jgi:predicted AAA+ superfamily ATPase